MVFTPRFRFAVGWLLLLSGPFSRATERRLVPLPDSIRAIGPADAKRGGSATAIVRTELTAAERSASIDFEVALKMRNMPELRARVERGEMIGRAEMEEKYLPTTEDYQHVADWLKGAGFTLLRADPSRLALFASGSVDQIRSGFALSFARVTDRGEEYTSATSAPQVPADVAPLIVGVNGLQQNVRARHLAAARPSPQSASGNVPPFFPVQIATAYGAKFSNLNGAGETIALVTDAAPLSSDIQAFLNATSIQYTGSYYTPYNVTGHALPAADAISTMTAEWCVGLAPGANLLTLATSDLQTPHLDMAYQLINEFLGQVGGLRQVVLCYGDVEGNYASSQIQADQQIFLTLAAAGVTVFAASGDGGSSPAAINGVFNPSAPAQVEYPASDPNVIAVGGTSLTLDGSSGLPTSETAWASTGGGVSTLFSRPAWQTGAGLPAGNTRCLPDVAFVADPNTGGLLVFNNQQLTQGGTAWATSCWAAIYAMVNQARAQNNLSPLGSLGSKLYPLLGSASFRDVTSGSNGAYSAGPNFDLCSGLGAPNFSILEPILANAPTVIVPPANTEVNVGQNATFSVQASGGLPLSYQWQRLPAGGTAWTNLTDNSVYSGTASTTLTVSVTTAAMNGDQFQCVVSNPSDSAVSSTSGMLIVAVPLVSTTLAGQPGNNNYLDGTTATAHLGVPWGVAIDASGNVWLTDTGYSTVREITTGGTVTTIAGTVLSPGTGNGTVAGLQFANPAGIAIDSSGALYVADAGNALIDRFVPGGNTLNRWGGSPAGYADGTPAAARFNDPQGVAVDAAGNIYVADSGNDLIRKISASGTVSTLAGTVGVAGSADGTGLFASFNAPSDVAVDAFGNVYVADQGNSTIRKITAAGVVSTLAGLAGTAGSADGPGTTARFSHPSSLALGPGGVLFVADFGNDVIREVTSQGLVTTVAGLAGGAGNNNGSGPLARFNQPEGIAVDSAGNVVVADTSNYDIRRLSVPAAPQVTAQPEGQTASAGSSVTLTAGASGTGLQYQWELNGVPVSGATGSSLVLPDVGSYQAGTYTVTVTNSGGATVSSGATVSVTVNAHLVNISTLAYIGSLSSGFVIAGSGTKQVLLRAVGPTLAQYNVSGALSAPQLTLYSGQSVIATDQSWGGSTQISSVFTQVGAFPLPTGSTDSVILKSLGSGPYSVQVSGVNGATGTALVELYDADTGTPATHLVNISSLGGINLGGSLTAGFSIAGTTSQTVLIRAIGPTLGGFGISGPIAFTQLTLYDGNQKSLATNAGWGGSATLVNVFNRVGAFALPLGSTDSALLVTLPPGDYSAQVTGPNASSGTALVEVYDVE